MSKQPFVSIILLNFNGKDYTIDCVNSILKSHYPKFEVLLIDNASTDNSYAVLRKKFQKNKKVRIFRSDTQLHFTGGHNFGARKARGGKLILLNNDTIVEKNWIRELVNFSKGHTKWLVQPKILNFQNKKLIDSAGEKYRFSGFVFGRGYNQQDRGQYDRNFRIDAVAGAAFMIDKEFFLSLGGFDPWFKNHYENIDLSLRAKKSGGECWFCFKSIVYHKGSLTIKTQLAKEKLVFRIRKNRLRTLIKNFSGFELVARLTALIPFYCLMIIQDLLSFKKEKMFITLKSVVEAIRQNTKNNIVVVE